MIEGYTTPLNGTPESYKSGYICYITKNNNYVPICKLTYELFWNNEFQYIFEPFYDKIDELKCGINGLDLDLRKDKYYRVNIEPQFLVSRVPPKSRADIQDFLRSLNLTYYDRMDICDRWPGRFGLDNLTFKYNPS